MPAMRHTTASDACAATRPDAARGSPAERVTGAAHGLNQTRAAAAVEARDFVDGLVTRGEHQNRNGAFATHRAADLEAVAAGQHDVENEQVDRLAAQEVKGRIALVGYRDAVAVDFQDAAHHAQHPG